MEPCVLNCQGLGPILIDWNLKLGRCFKREMHRTIIQRAKLICQIYLSREYISAEGSWMWLYSARVYWTFPSEIL